MSPPEDDRGRSISRSADSMRHDEYTPRMTRIADLMRDHGHAASSPVPPQGAFVRPPIRASRYEIRLLRIIPCTDPREHPIRCTLEVYRRAEVQHKYVAISYTWGPVEPTMEIEVNGRPLRVRQNCWIALWQMRCHNVAGLYWMDSICINQDYHIEKQLQVARMGDVYTNAGMVAVCVGDYDRSLDTQWVWTRAGIHSLVERFFQREYFHRLWTVQESCLARYIRVFCGWSWIDWHHLAHGLYSPEEVAMRNYDDAWERILKDGLSPFVPHRNLDISRAILLYGRRCCHDLRDKIYSLLSLASPNVRRRIDIDYSRRLFDVMLDYVGVYERLVEAPRRGSRQSSRAELFPGEDPLTGNITDMWRSVQFLGRTFAKSSSEFRANLDEALAKSLGRVGCEGTLRGEQAHQIESTTVPIEVMVDGVHVISGRGDDYLDTAGRFFVDESDSVSTDERQWQRPMKHCTCCLGDVTLGFDTDPGSLFATVRMDSRSPPKVPHRGPVCLLQGNQDEWQGVPAFQVPAATRYGDVLMYCQATYPLITDRRRRVVFVCRERKERPGTFRILGRAIHLVGGWPCPVGFRLSGLWTGGSTCHLALAIDKLLLAFLMMEPETNLLIPLIVTGFLTHSDLDFGSIPGQDLGGIGKEDTTMAAGDDTARRRRLDAAKNPNIPERYEVGRGNITGPPKPPENKRLCQAEECFPEPKKLNVHDLLRLLTGVIAQPPGRETGRRKRADTPTPHEDWH